MELKTGNVSNQKSDGFSIEKLQQGDSLLFPSVILLHTGIPNAFVSEMLPQRVFVTTGLFDQFVTNDDELAMIMGHELSHLVLGHGKERLLVDFMLRGLEIAFLMLERKASLV